MSYRFRRRESLGPAVRRVLLEELDSARVELMASVSDAEALHEVRKRIKRMRALLRLGRDTVAGVRVRMEDQVLRDVGRMLAAHREADALFEILRVEASAARSADLRLLEHTVHLHQVARAPLRRREADVARARRLLGGVRRRVAGWVPERIGRKDCLRRLKHSYRRARDQWWLTVSDPTDENLHAWRKFTKILLNQVRLVRGLAGGGLPRFRTSLADIDNRLGQARDSAHLAGILRGVPVAEIPLRYGLGLRARLEHTVDDQLSRAFAVGRRMYRFRSREFLERILGSR